MLNDSQKEKLKKLTEECPIPKLKRILEDAVPKWISGEVIPKQGSFGVDYSNDIFVLNKKPSHRGCCLLGTALLEKEVIKTIGSVYNDWEDMSVHYHYNLTLHEAVQVVNGFDDEPWISKEDENLEFYQYTSKVRKVLFEC